jgi:hypothetical protein
MAYILESIKKVYGEDSIRKSTFYDLGSVSVFLTKGSGMGVLSAATLYPFKRCVGIEMLSSLHQYSLKNKVTYELEFGKYFKENKHLFPLHEKLPQIDFLQGNFLETDWTEGSFVFTNSTTFAPQVMDEIFNRAQVLKKGSFFVNTSKHFPKDYIHKWDSIRPFMRLMSWGCVTLFIHRKR